MEKKEPIIISRIQAINKIVDHRSLNKFGIHTRQWTIQQIFESNLTTTLQGKNNEELMENFHELFPGNESSIQGSLFKQTVL